jgi:Mn-containing catalase
VDAGVHHLQGKAKSVSTTSNLADLIRDFLVERTGLLMRHEDVAQQVPDYDINNAYQYIIAREETHLSWLQHALLDLAAPLPSDPPRQAVAVGKCDAWKTLAADDARANAQFVDKWRGRVDEVSHARHRGMLKIVLGEMLEHKRLFDQAAAGNKNLIGTSLAINDHAGVVMSARWTGQ